MFARISHTQLLRYAGLFTWAMVGLPLLYVWLSPISAGELSLEDATAAPIAFGWLLAAYLIFGFSYAWVTRRLGRRLPRWDDNALLLVMTVAAIAVSYFNSSGLGSILLMVAAGVMPWLLPLPVALVWLLCAHLAVIPVFHWGLKLPLSEAAMQSLLYAGFSYFVFVTGLVARQQAQAREQQARLNSELRATRALLAESSRLSERMRISRDLHDLLGHHLTALSLNLEVAGHLSEGKAQEHVRQAHTLARLLLTDVREAVSRLREDGAVELSAALRTLTEGVSSLEIHLDMPQPFAIDDPERATVLLRCTQEIITNAVRHAYASHLWLRFAQNAGALEIEARDDGRGADHFAPGNGLRGMRERLSQHAGSVDIHTARGQGFALKLHLPMDPQHV